MIHRSLDVLGDVVLARTGRVGATPDGLEYEWEQIAVMVWAAGLLRRVELFAVTDGARQRRLGSTSSPSVLASRRTSTTGSCGSPCAPSGWDASADDPAVTFYRETACSTTAVPGVNAGTVTGGAEAVDASIQSGVDVFGVLEIELARRPR